MRLVLPIQLDAGGIRYNNGFPLIEAVSVRALPVVVPIFQALRVIKRLGLGEDIGNKESLGVDFWFPICIAQEVCFVWPQ
ncbi:hypothetical protein D3C86_1161780 [compost metagenome]